MEIFGIDVPLWLLLLLSVIFAYYRYMTALFGTFNNSPGLKGPRPWPIIGTMLPIFQRGIPAQHKEFISKYGKVVPHFMGRQPALLVADAEIIREVLIKRFSNFSDHFHMDFPAPADNMMLVLTGEKWKRVRNLVTPTFSSAKMRQMNDAINRCCQVLTTNLKKTGGIVDVREFMGTFTMDVIASTAFGLDIDSQSDPDNPFVTYSKKAFLEDATSPILLVGFFLPFLTKYLAKLGFSLIPKDALNFFVKIIEKAISQRSKEDTNRTDFLQLMINAHHDEELGSSLVDESDNARRGLTHNEVLAQGVSFFVGGFDTVANSCSFALYCLATNTHTQDKLLDEIQDVLEENENPTYDSVMKMKYLEKVVSESLRLHTPFAMLERLCNNDITINGVFIPKGVDVTIPIDYLHHDPEVYPDPDTFDPERFTEEAKSQRDPIYYQPFGMGPDPIYYQPFGMGPRHCVAIRLALLEVKMSIVNILRHFSIHTCAETGIPVKRDVFSGRPKGIILEFRTRSH